MDIEAANQPSQPTRQALAIEGRSGRLKVTGKLRVALDLMAWQALKRDDAAAKAGLSVHGLYAALRKPHVKQYYLEQIEVLRLSERSRNIHRLTQIRDAADNMPAVQAIKMLEQLSDDGPAAGSNRQAMPGLVVQINMQPAVSPSVDVKQINGLGSDD